MGLDFLQRMAPQFKKAVSRDAETVARMACGVSSEGLRRVVVADISLDASVQAGQCLVAQLVSDQLVLVSGLHEVGRVLHPPSDVVRKLHELGGYSDGLVEHVNTMGGTFDVALP